MSDMSKGLAEEIDAFLADPSTGVRPESRRDPVIEQFKSSLEDDANRSLFDLFLLYVNGVGSETDEERVASVLKLASAMGDFSRPDLHDILFAALSRLLELELATKELIESTDNLVTELRAAK
jgi:hypothetical protein